MLLLWEHRFHFFLFFSLFLILSFTRPLLLCVIRLLYSPFGFVCFFSFAEKNARNCSNNDKFIFTSFHYKCDNLFVCCFVSHNVRNISFSFHSPFISFFLTFLAFLMEKWISEKQDTTKPNWRQKKRFPTMGHFLLFHSFNSIFSFSLSIFLFYVSFVQFLL